MPSELYESRGIGSVEYFRQSLNELEAETKEFQQQIAIRGVLEPSNRYKGAAVAPYLDQRRLDEDHLRTQVLQAANAQEIFVQQAQNTINSFIQWRADAQAAVRNGWIQAAAGLVGAVILIAILIAI